jgi:hypothetical protein
MLRTIRRSRWVATCPYRFFFEAAFDFRQASQRVSLHCWQKSQSLQECFRSDAGWRSGTQIIPSNPLILIQAIGSMPHENLNDRLQ